MFLYWCASIAVAGGKVQRVLSISWVFVIYSPHSRSWAVMLWSSASKESKSGKSSTRRLIQSFLASGKKNVCSWWNLSCSWVHKSVGWLISIYCCLRDGSMCRRSRSKVWNLRTSGMPSAISLFRYIVSSSAPRAIFASFAHSMKLVPSAFRGLSWSACSQASTCGFSVAMDTIYCEDGSMVYCIVFSVWI